MHQGNWTCSGCGGEIKELPFEPRSTEGLMCRECHQKQKGGGGASSSSSPTASSEERKKYQGEWKCADCGAAITELPFEPRNTTNLKCIDCFKKSRG